MSYELKPCPFCGCTEPQTYGCGTFGDIECPRCKAVVKSGINLADAVDKWNRRDGAKTCRILYQHYYDSYDVYYAELSCGHNLETRDKPKLSVRYCPECGAKVMWDE